MRIATPPKVNATLGMFAQWNFRHPALDVSRVTRFSGLVPRFHSEIDTLPANMSRSYTFLVLVLRMSQPDTFSPSDADVCPLLLGIFVSFSSHGVFTCLKFSLSFPRQQLCSNGLKQMAFPLHLLHFVCLG